MSRDRAAEVVAAVAERLADPDAVAGITAELVDSYPDGHDAPAWQPESLADGHPGIAVLHAELGDRRGAHAQLIATNRTGGPAPADDAHRLFAGRLPGLMFGALAAAQRPGEYADLLQQTGTLVATAVQQLAAAELDRIAAGGSGARFAAYDLLSGLSGGLRLLLASGAQPAAAEDAVRALIALTEPVRPADGGPERPGWYVEHSWSGADAEGQAHLNLGLSHGVPGVLAVLSVAYRDGVRVPGQAEAIERIVAWLLDQQDDRGWPEVVGLSGEVLLATGRPGWCYGVPGLARALYLAGDALDVAAWRRTAVDALAGTLARPWDGFELREAGLCHGWAGLLQITSRLARDTGDDRLASALPALADRVLGCHQPESPFGFRYTTGTTVRMAADRPGFLWGAAGIALALQSYATDRPPATGWDAALLLT